MKIKCGKCQRVDDAKEIVTYAKYSCKHCDTVNEVTNIELKEWLGFNYNEFLESIEKFIKRDEFIALKASTQIEEEAGKLSPSQVNKLRNILIQSFNEGYSIRDISRKIKNEVVPKNLYEIKNGEVTDRILSSADRRPLMIARTESTRVAAEGTLINYKDNGIKEVAWLSSTGERTCDLCAGNNGMIMTESAAHGKIPAHPYCRCTFIPIVKSSVNKNLILVESVTK